MTLQAILAVVLVALTLAPAPIGQAGPPGDGEIRTTKDPATNGTITTVTLVLSGPKGPVPVNMAIASAQKPSSSSVGTLRLEFNLSTFVGELDTKTPHVEFVLDRSSRTVTANVDASTFLPGRKFIQVPFDAARLKALASATSVTGKAFGIDFVLTPSQMRAIKQFAAAVR